jgi:purine-binding chemotaxis protein CheW
MTTHELRDGFREDATQDTPAARLTALLMRAGTSWLAIEVHEVDEITDVPVITKLPKVPHHIPGVMNHRGVAIPLLDIRRFLDLPEDNIHFGAYGSSHSHSVESSSSGTSRVVIVSLESMRVGLLCDAARSITEIHPEQVHEVEVLQGDQLRAFTRKELDLPEGRAALLDMASLLHSARIKAP